MTLEQFIKELKRLPKEYRNINVLTPQQNGLLTPPEIKFELIEHFNHYIKSKDNIKNIIIT